MIIQIKFRRVDFNPTYYRITYDDSIPRCVNATASIITRMRPLEAQYYNPFNIKFKDIIIIN